MGDTLDKAVAYLKKRDGTDKLLKILRYSAKLALAAHLMPPDTEAFQKTKSFEASVGVSRKALRLGKFLQDVDDLRRLPSFATPEGLLELLALGAEGVYYFLEQFVWLVKAGVVDKRHGPRLQYSSAWFELLGYCGSVTLKAMQVSALLRKEHLLKQQLLRHSHSQHVGQGRHDPNATGRTRKEASGKEGEGPEGDTGRMGKCEETDKLVATLRSLQFKRVLKTLSLIQDAADSFLALADVVDEKKQPLLLRSPILLSAAGLLSALISAHKNWVAS